MSNFKVKIYHFLPFLLTILLSILFAYILLKAYNIPPLRLTFPVKGSFLFDAFYFTLTVAFAGLAVYMLSKHKRFKILKVLIFLSYFTIVFILYVFYLPAFLWFIGVFNLSLSLPAFFLVCIVAASLTLYCIFVVKGLPRNILILVFVSSLGALLGFTIPTLSLTTILLALSIYDAFAVSVGPIRKLVTLADSTSKWVLTELSFTYKNIFIGLGDLILYSSLIAHIYIFFSLQIFLLCFIIVLLGIFLSLKMLEKWGMFPGLPITIIPPVILLLTITLFNLT